MSTIGSDSVVGVLPTGADVVIGTDGGIVVNKPVEEAKFDVTGDTEFSGKAVKDSEVVVKGKQGETTTVTVEDKFKETDIKNRGKGALEVEFSGGNFTKGKITSSKSKSSDSISFQGKSTINRGLIKAGKGNDSITFAKGTKYKGKTTIDLGKGGKDSVVVENNKVKGGNLVITNFTKKDTITIGGETFTFKDIKNGAELPGVKVELR